MGGCVATATTSKCLYEYKCVRSFTPDVGCAYNIVADTAPPANPSLYGKKRIMACTCTRTIAAFVRLASRVTYLLVRVPYSSENAGLPAAVFVRVQVLTGTSSKLYISLSAQVGYHTKYTCISGN